MIDSSIETLPLIEAIELYKIKHYPHLKWMKDYYKKLSLSQAIDQGARGLNPEKGGKQLMNSHQRRVGLKKCEEGALALSKWEKEFQQCSNFKELYDTTIKAKQGIKKLGPLWTYDTTLRIAFSKGEKYYPRKVYVQSGVKDGIRKLYKNMKPPSRRSIEVDDLYILSSELRKLKPYMLEHFFCVWGKSERGNDKPKRKSSHYC
ncbi:hypothetical protein [Acidiluteibacter ferrifornacis]|uniref:Uncharacterized protein n=1 Tax=Acidiluteibacter ferrifornacis TaxID=2692424 RepID=A0A6N9NHP6_9FLAO|nr:hypothetical protein [Acidiluteibacter ferrifornacis]NBG66206.1 hypothetical protein [Acidiluteibacter ferrifornacis]